MWEVIKNVISLASAAIPYIESKVPLLPVNPAIREDLLGISMYLAAAGGIGGYQSARRIPCLRFIGIACLFLCALCIGFLLMLTNNHSFGLTPVGVSTAVRLAYASFFLLAGLTIGGLLGLS